MSAKGNGERAGLAFALAGCTLVASAACQSPRDIQAVSSAPYPPSELIATVTWDWRALVRLAPGSDLWPVTWGPDDHLYTSWGDGGGFGGTNSDGRVSLGFARIEGTPEAFTTHNVWGGRDAEHAASFGGKSPSLLSVHGVLYAWINVQNGVPWDMTLAWSDDLGASWHMEPWRFPGRAGEFSPEAFLNFGRDYSGARDAYVYTYGRTWGDDASIELARAPVDSLRTIGAYEFFAGTDGSGQAVWSRTPGLRQPVFRDPNGAMAPRAAFNAGLDRYLLFVAHGQTVSKPGIFEAPTPWGPWRTVAYYEHWGELPAGEPLGYSVPTKWTSEDGTRFWIVFSSTGELDAFHLVPGSFTLRGGSSNPH